MSMQTIDRAIRWWAIERDEQTAIWVSGRSVNFSELNTWVGRVAALLAEAGFGLGDRASFYAETSLEWCIAAFAVMRCGGIVAGINSRMVAAEVDYLLGQYAPTAVFADAEGAERLDASTILGQRTDPRFIFRLDPDTVAALREAPAADVSRPLDPDAPMAIITTSGSTARPKGVVYSHRAMIDYATYEAIANDHDLGEDYHKLLTTAPLSTAGGFNLMVHSIVVGGSVYMQKRFDPGEALETLHEQRINIFRANPIFFQRMAEHPRFSDANLSSVKIATVGGAAVADWLLQTWWNKGVVVCQLYGQTEAGGSITINPKRYAKSDPDRCGYGGPFTEIAIIDADGAFLPPNQPGQIVAQGPGMMLGYWNNPEATSEVMVDGWLRTGDIGVIDERGLVKMLDRMKDIIKSGGLNISSAEIERVILELPGITEVAIISAHDEKFGETPFAIVHGKNVSIPALIEHCNAQLSAYKVPRYVVISDSPLPRLAMGKISKPELRAQYGGDRPLPPRVR